MIISILFTDRSTHAKLKELTLTVIDDCPGRLFLYCGRKVSGRRVFKGLVHVRQERLETSILLLQF